MKKKDKEERRKYVKKQREKLKENPRGFLKKEIIDPTIKYWKEEPIHAIGTLITWIIIYYLIFGGIQAVNNDMIYCDSTINEYDGKVMYVYNDFVKYYNERTKELQQGYQPEIIIQINQTEEFNKKYSMFCNYNISRWNKEPIWEKEIREGSYCDERNGCKRGRIETITEGLVKILGKQS